MQMEQPPTKESRVPVNLRIKFRSETIEQFVERYAVDVSRGGIFIRTREPLAVGTQLKFDFQLQDTSPLMAGEGTVVWIREHDPTRAGVTPGMGVRFDKLTPASQPVLDKILADKGRAASGPTSTAPTATSSGKSGASALPMRRPSSTFSAVEPSLLGVPTTGLTPGLTPGLTTGAAPAGGSAGSGPPAGTPGATAPLAASGAPGGPSTKSTQPLSSPSLFKVPGAATPTSAPASGAIPSLESQSALGRLATGPNLSTFGPVGTAPRTKSPLPLLSKAATGDASGRITSTAGAPSVPTPLEDSERTQIADGLPEFSHEQPTHVGGPALGLTDFGAAHGATITATSRRTPTPPPEPKLSLDGGMTPGMIAPGAAAATPATSPARTTSPDGTQGATGTGAASGAGRLSANRPAVGPVAGPLDTDLASTVPASARISAVKPVVQTNTPHATPRIEDKKRPTATFIVVGVLVGAAAAAGIALKMSNRPEEAAAPATATAPATPQAATPPATAPTPSAANPEATKTEPAGTTVAANPTAAPKPGEPEGKAAEPAAPAAEAKPAAKPGEAKPGEAKTDEAKPGEAKLGEAKPAEPEAAKPAVAEPVKAGRKPHQVAHKKGAGATSAEAASAEGADAIVGGDAANVARVISLPTGAEVLIDGQLVGKTPFQGKDIDPAAPHALTVRKEGFETYEHMVSASDWMKGKGPGQSLRVTVKLRKAHGAGEPEAGGDKRDKPTEPGATEPPKSETPPASETP
jgi:uncharacterized protein (TIGR02266 family)